jgi:glycosidase
MTFPGTPFIYYGDEVGMWGADDPDERKPMVWSDLKYESENIHPLGLKRAEDSVEANDDLLEFYKNIIRIRRENPACQQGNYQLELVDDEHGIFAFSRSLNDNKVLAIFNSSAEKCTLDLSALGVNKNENWQLIGGYDIQNGILSARGYSIYAQN